MTQFSEKGVVLNCVGFERRTIETIARVVINEKKRKTACCQSQCSYDQTSEFQINERSEIACKVNSMEQIILVICPAINFDDDQETRQDRLMLKVLVSPETGNMARANDLIMDLSKRYLARSRSIPLLKATSLCYTATILIIVASLISFERSHVHLMLEVGERDVRGMKCGYLCEVVIQLLLLLSATQMFESRKSRRPTGLVIT